MAWTWIRPVDASLLSGRPLLDLGTGDGQTVAALAPSGLVVGVDRSLEVLRAARRVAPRVACAAVTALPIQDGSIATVLAADLFHHLDDDGVVVVAREIRRVLAPGAHVVAWWWETPGTSAPDAPRYTRTLEPILRLLQASGLHAQHIDLNGAAPLGPRTVGVAATSR